MNKLDLSKLTKALSGTSFYYGALTQDAFYDQLPAEADAAIAAMHERRAADFTAKTGLCPRCGKTCETATVATGLTVSACPCVPKDGFYAVDMSKLRAWPAQSATDEQDRARWGAAIGDYVRWEWPSTGRWAEGELLGVRDEQWRKSPPSWDRKYKIVVRAHGGLSDALALRLGEPHEFGVDRDGNSGEPVRTVRRVERPTDKLARVEQLNADLQAGRVRLPAFEVPAPIPQACLDEMDRMTRSLYELYGVATFAGVDRSASVQDLRVKPADPLDAMIDGVTLRDLLDLDTGNARNDGPRVAGVHLSPDQRDAVSAHWSAELRAKVAASREAERNTVRVDLQDEP